MLDAMGTPALITDIAWNVLAWNRELAEHLQDPAQVSDSDRNAILWRFGPVSATRFPAEQRNLGLLVGWVRSAYLAEGGQNPALGRLVERLLAIPEAARHWNDGALALEPLLETRMLVHPLHGQRRVRVMRTLLPQYGLRISQFIPVTPGGEETPGERAR